MRRLSCPYETKGFIGLLRRTEWSPFRLGGFVDISMFLQANHDLVIRDMAGDSAGCRHCLVLCLNADAGSNLKVEPANVNGTTDSEGCLQAAISASNPRNSP